MSIPKSRLSPKILLVDDEIQQLWLRAQVMKTCGFVITDSPREAISMMAEGSIEDIDLVILDYKQRHDTLLLSPPIAKPFRQETPDDSAQGPPR